MLPQLFTERLQEFSETISVLRPAFTYVRLNFLAVRDQTSGRFVILKGTVFFNTGKPPIPDRFFQTPNVKVGSFLVETLGFTPDELMMHILSGEIKTPIGIVCVAVRQLDFNPFVIENQNRFSVLSAYGSAASVQERMTGLDWEVRAAPEPYDGLQELASEFGLGGIQPQSGGAIDFITFNVMALDGQSHVSGDTAHIVIRLANGLDTNLAKVSYRELMHGKVVSRKSIENSEIIWENGEDFSIGTAKIPVTSAAALQCFCTYSGSVQHIYWIADPSTSQNARRATYEIFDPGMNFLKETFRRESYRGGRDARELEANISWLLWMLGFSVAHLGATPRVQDAVDILATSPAGHFAVIECTTGLLRADNKLPKLLERAEAVRRRIEASGNRHLRVIAVIVTTKTREEIAGELEQAERLKILVVAREDLERACEGSVIHQDTDALFERAEAAIRESLARYAAQQQLTLPLASAAPIT